ncbi:MAG: 1-(5-phosphoribosyl)-5-amino-4-imidazole-carboxylate carboxylase, partial [Fuerstiella sp.]|nr:1-(5-phosphoribosyl)-5-amino-4-imidazole-carboxylate carboxylase [Fuerstiella sp.]
IVCVAGMEAALPSVVGGLVGCPVIGVPTSVGYGASFGGLTAMLSMLTCCASNVVTVNIDAGFRGGYVAGMIATGAGTGRIAETSEATLNG